MSVEIVGPFDDYRLVVDGWGVPFIQARELDGGRIDFTVDHRLAFHCCAADFEQVSRLVANAVAVALGMPSHPSGDMTAERRQSYMGHVPFSLRPSRLIGITSVATESAETRRDE